MTVDNRPIGQMIMFTKQQTILRDLGNGLILRYATQEDADALVEFNGKIHGENPLDTQRVAAWTHDLLARPHPTLRPGDFTIVEETITGRIVSSMNLIPQTWTYEEIEFRVGRPELVGTLPEYRNRGLVRLQFEVIHQWSAERGHMVQGITGIPYYYRLFGYEMALDMAGRRLGYESHVPKLKDGEEEPYRIRPATEADVPFIADLYERAIRRHAIACVRTPEIFKYELSGQSRNNINYFIPMIIEEKTGESVGYFLHSHFLRAASLLAAWYELKPGISWLAVTPSVVRYLWNKGQECAKVEGKPCTAFGFMLGLEHPAYEVLGNNLPYHRQPYAWYLRVPDLPGFLNHIKPALEKRLAESIAVGHSREIKISFYRTGLRLVLEKGRLATIEPWKSAPADAGAVAFPGLTFLQILFGYRSYDELHQSFADCWCDNEEVRALINILFPKKVSDVFPVS
jgi:hypothetical protein